MNFKFKIRCIIYSNFLFNDYNIIWPLHIKIIFFELRLVSSFPNYKVDPIYYMLEWFITLMIEWSMNVMNMFLNDVFCFQWKWSKSSGWGYNVRYRDQLYFIKRDGLLNYGLWSLSCSSPWINWKIYFSCIDTLTNTIFALFLESIVWKGIHNLSSHVYICICSCYKNRSCIFAAWILHCNLIEL